MANAEMVETAAIAADIGKVNREGAKYEGRKLEADDHAASVAGTALALQAFRESRKSQQPLYQEPVRVEALEELRTQYIDRLDIEVTNQPDS